MGGDSVAWGMCDDSSDGWIVASLCATTNPTNQVNACRKWGAREERLPAFCLVEWGGAAAMEARYPDEKKG